MDLSELRNIDSLHIVRLFNKKKGYPEKNGIEINLVPLDAEFSAEQHIQNPLKSVVGKINYSRFNFKNFNL